MTQKSHEVDERENSVLSRELSELLVELSIGLHRYAMYPPDHPSLGPAAEKILRRLSQILPDSSPLSIGVAAERLIVEGVLTDASHPVLRDLARRLHAHQIGALSFDEGVTASELESLLTTLAQEPERGGQAVGELPPDEIPTWEHLTIFPLGYDQLHLSSQGGIDPAGSERIAELWIGLAQAAMKAEGPMGRGSAPDGHDLAKSIQGHQKESAYDQVIGGYLRRLAQELRENTGEEAEVVRQQVSRLITALDDPTLARLVHMGGDFSQRKRFVLDANQSLTVESVMRILKAAASSSEQTISNSMTRLLTKLAVQAETGPGNMRDQADTVLRDNVEEILRDWELSDPNPETYSLVLDSMARSAPIFASSRREGEVAGPERLVQMALEVDTYGPTVMKAALDLVELGRLPRLLELLESAPDDRLVGARLKQLIASPDQLRRLLSGEDVDPQALRQVVDRMGDDAIEPLLDVLTDSESKAVRMKVFHCLADMGSRIRDAIMRRVDDPRWYVVRNMLALAQHLEEVPRALDLETFMEHEDPRVRREALPLAVRDPQRKARALAEGLADEDESVVRLALAEILKDGELEDVLVPTLVHRVVGSERTPEVRVMGIRSLALTGSTLARDALLDVVIEGKSLLGRPKLAHGSEEVVAALSVLGSMWSRDPLVAPVLQAAGRSRDAEIREAASSGGNG